MLHCGVAGKMHDVGSMIADFRSRPVSAESAEAIAALQQQIAAAARGTGRSKRDNLSWVYTLLKEVLTKIDDCKNSSGGEAVLDQLLQLADAGFRCCHHISSSKSESHLVLLYSYMKKLASARRLPAALRYGEQLFAELQHTETDETSSMSQLHQDLTLGASLNIIMCICKLGKDVLLHLNDVNGAAHRLLGVLR